MFGKIEMEKFEGLKEMPQEAASAWGEIDQLEILGASYKPLLYVGKQQVKGTNYFFLAEQTFINKENDRRLIQIAINHFDGKYTVIPQSIKPLDFEI